MGHGARQLNPGVKGSVSISVSRDTDYKTLALLLEPSDVIQSTIRWKEDDRRGKKSISFVRTEMVIAKVESDGESIHVRGRIESGKTVSLWITDDSNFELTKKLWTKENLEILRRVENKEDLEDDRNSNKQNHAISAVRKCLWQDSELLTFGDDETFSAVEDGSLEFMILTDVVLQRHTKERRTRLVNPSGRYMGAEIVVLTNKSPEFSEIAAYGGCVGVRRYHSAS
jgi:stalled ribosome rescue protein Dom34